MFCINAVVLYVEDINISKSFYENLFACKGLSLSHTFVSFNLQSGSLLELKQRKDSTPKSNTAGGGTELSIKTNSEEKLIDIYQTWQKNDVMILQHPEKLIFGITFVALDPDQHRIRVFCEL